MDGYLALIMMGRSPTNLSEPTGRLWETTGSDAPRKAFAMSKPIACSMCFEIKPDDALVAHHGICSDCDAHLERRYAEEEEQQMTALYEMDQAFDMLG